MHIYLIKKEKNRVYESEKIVLSLTGKALTHNDEGAPAIEGGLISISDTKAYWACVICGVNTSLAHSKAFGLNEEKSSLSIGLDIEEIGRKVSPALLRRYADDEIRYLEPLEEASKEWSLEMLHIWTRKEAVSKCFGKGLSLGLKNIGTIGDELSYLPIIELEGEEIAVNSFEIGKNLVMAIALPMEMDKILANSKETLLSANNALDGPSFSETVVQNIDQQDVILADYDAPFIKSAYASAEDMLAERNHSSGELRNKLSKKGYPQDQIEEAIDKLIRNKYINDEDYASRLAEKSAGKGRSGSRIVVDLMKKGIDKEVAKMAASAQTEGERERAFEIAVKALSSGDIKDPKIQAKIARKLASLGYEAGVIYDIIDRLKL